MREKLTPVIPTILTAIVVIALCVVILAAVNTIKAGNRAIGCELAIDPTARTSAAVDQCFTDQGLDPP